MGLRITKDVLYYAENNEWKPLPVIKGDKGDDGRNGNDGLNGADAYHAWLEEEHLEDTTENYRRWIQEIGRAAVIGASRVVVEDVGGVPTKVAYTPKKLNPSDTQEPPAEGTHFVTYDGTTASCDRIVLGGDSTAGSEVRYKGITTASTYDRVSPILFAPSYPVDGSLVSEIGYIQSPSSAIGDVGYNPKQFVFVAGNRSSVSNAQRTGSTAATPQLRLCTNIGSVASLPTAYKGKHDVNIALLGGENGNLYIGGTTAMSNKGENDKNYCPRGSTIINGGLASLYGVRYNMQSGATTSAPNAVMILRGKSGTTDGTWSYYNNVDSGHVEHIRVPFKPAPTTALTYGQRYYPGTSNQVYSTTAIESLYLNNLNTTWNSKATDNSHSYDVIIQTNNKFTNPYIQYSVLGEEMAYITPFADYFNIWGVRYDNSRGQLHFSISCKKSKNISRYPTYTTEHPAYVYIDFMLFTNDYK